MEGSAMDFDAHSIKREEDRDEDAELDETLLLDDADRSVWSLKVPDFLYHRWMAASQRGDERLGTLRMTPSRNPDEPGTFSILLPEELGQAQVDPSKVSTEDEDKMLGHAIPSQYEVMINNEHSTNLFVLGESELQPGPSKKRKREPFIAGTVKHECNVKPTMNAEYKRIMQQRAERAAEPKRKMKMMEASIGELNRMAAGVGNVESGANFKGFVKGKVRGGDKTLRLPRPEIEVAIFQLYDIKAQWGVQELTQRLSQPMAYVKEVLNDIGQSINHGPYKGQYALKAAFKSKTTEPDANAQPAMKVDDEDDEQLFDEVA